MKDGSDVGRHESVTESKDSQNVDAVAVRSVFFGDFSSRSSNIDGSPSPLSNLVWLVYMNYAYDQSS